MKIFLDTADLDEIRRAAEANLIDGVTTNPSLIAQVAGKRDPKEIYREICETVDGPISAEVVGTDKDTMLVEGRKLAALHDNIVGCRGLEGVACFGVRRLPVGDGDSALLEPHVVRGSVRIDAEHGRGLGRTDGRLPVELAVE